MSVRKKIVLVKGEPVTFWIADYFDGSGQRHQRRYKTKKEAAAHHDSIKTAIRSGEHVAVPHNLTVADATAKWLKHVAAQGAERGTIRTYTFQAKHILPKIGALKLSKMTKGHVTAFRDSLLEGDKALSRDLASKVMRSLKSVLKHAHVGHLADNVTVKRSKREEPLKVGRDIPTADEIARIVEKTGSMRIRTLVMVAASTGLRASELRGLPWSNVNLATGEIDVHQRADRFGVIGAPKTTGSVRTVPIGPKVILALKEWRLKCPKVGDLDLVFPTSEGTVENHSNLLRSLESAMRDAGVVTKGGEAKYSMHGFRHFFASWCINSKAKGGRELPPKEAQVLLGHSTIKMTLDTYGHLFPERRDRAELEASEKALFG